jgi:hypothetical protein
MLQFAPNMPATEAALSALVRATTAKPLPEEFIEFLRQGNGGEGFLNGRYAILWRAEELLDFNRDYQTAELAPDLFLIGTNGGGEAYAFDQSFASSAVFLVPLIGMDYKYAEKIADSFLVFMSWRPTPPSKSTSPTH